MRDILSSRRVRRGGWKGCGRGDGVLMVGNDRSRWTHIRAGGGRGIARGDFRSHRGIMVMMMGCLHVHCIAFFFGGHTSRCRGRGQWHRRKMLITLHETIESSARRSGGRTWCEWRSLSPGEKSIEMQRFTKREQYEWICRSSQSTNVRFRVEMKARAKQRQQNDEVRFVDTSSEGKKEVAHCLLFFVPERNQLLSSRVSLADGVPPLTDRCFIAELTWLAASERSMDESFFFLF